MPNAMGLEIGCLEGRSSCWFCDHVLTGDGAQLTCVDIWRNAKRERGFDANTAGLPIRKIKAKSVRGLSELVLDNTRYNFIYVDANHHASYVFADLAMAWWLLLPGGVMICDDYNHRPKRLPVPPKPAIDAFLTCCKPQIAKHEIAPAPKKGHKVEQVAIWKKR
jgi:predicted O-methyltransferase YrrM